MNANAELDDLLRHPIEVSLRAGIKPDFDVESDDDDKDPGRYNDPHKRSPSSLFEANKLDVFCGPRWKLRPVYGNWTQLQKPVKYLEESEDSPFDGDEMLTMRLIVTRPTYVSVNGLYFPEHHDLSAEGQQQINFMPFSTTGMHAITMAYNLPTNYMWLRAHAREIGNFVRETEWSPAMTDGAPQRAERIAFVVNWPFVLRPAAHLDLEVEAGGNLGVSHKADYDRRGAWTADDPFIWSLAFSHDLRNGTSRGIMDGVTDIALEDIANRLENPHPKWSKHPVYLVLILLDVSMEHTLWDVNRLAKNLFSLEDYSQDFRYMDRSIKYFDDITTKIAYLSRSLNFLSNLTDFLLDTLCYLEKTLEPTAAQIPSSERPKLSREASMQQRVGNEKYIKDMNVQISEHLKNIQYLLKNFSDACTGYRSRAADCLNLVNTKLNRQDAKNNRTMSIVTMAFLPVAAVAAVASINIFNWNNGNFWIFWLVSILFTGLVLVVWGAWNFRYYWLTRRRKKRQRAKKVPGPRKREGKGAAELTKSFSRNMSRAEKGLGIGSAEEEEERGGGGNGNGRKRKSRPRNEREGRSYDDR